MGGMWGGKVTVAAGIWDAGPAATAGEGEAMLAAGWATGKGLGEAAPYGHRIKQDPMHRMIGRAVTKQVRSFGCLNDVTP